MLKLSTLTHFPIKACRGWNRDSAFVERRGLRDDRRMMIVDLQGIGITQRDHAPLALVVPDLVDGRLNLSAPHMPALSIPLLSSGPIRQASIWDSSGIRAVDQGDEVAEWLSKYLDFSVRLVRMNDESVRDMLPGDALQPGDQVSFADGYPILIASQESLDDLNARLETPLPMNRFRPNLVVSGCAPFAEDGWKRIRIGEVEMALLKPCARCEVTTIDQATAVQGKEPLKTMATFRRVNGNKVMFGVNVIPLNEGRLRVGDPVEILA